MTSGTRTRPGFAAATDLFVLQGRLGRESITTTTETYAHLMPDQQRAAADVASRALGGLVSSQLAGLRLSDAE
jgi:hypothetical protein